MTKVVNENWAPELRAMQVGDVIELPIKKYSSIRVTIARLELENCVEGWKWEKVETDRVKGTFRIRRLR